jgi:hypothetical protein
MKKAADQQVGGFFHFEGGLEHEAAVGPVDPLRA